MMNFPEYKDSLRKLKTVVYSFGEKINNVVDHPLFEPHINSAGLTYELAHDPRYEDLMTATSHLTGEKINRFTHIHQSTGDLVKKVKMLRMIAQKTGTCFQRCVGFDAMNAIYSVTYEMDQKNGTDYHTRFKEYVKAVQRTDMMVAGSMTDPKGDRSKSPSEQPDPDAFVHVVEKREDGIVIRGAKSHQTGILNSHEMLIMPTEALMEADQDYAVCCAVPVDAEGILHIFGRQTNDTRRLEEGAGIDLGNIKYGTVGGECLTVLNDVFVPWEKVFMCGEYEFAGMLVERFSSYHRQNYGACKTGIADVIIGAAAGISQYNGAAKASHIKDKVADMIHMQETLYCCSIACSAEGSPTAAGNYYVDTMLANCGKLNITRFIYEICRLAHDIAGGYVATLPSEKDLKHPEIGKYVGKYHKGVPDVPAEHRIRMGRLLECLTGGTALLESMHGAGSPQAMKIMLLRQANLNHKFKLACTLAGIAPAEKK
ncbi:4-hydroxyphenylacetate 3-hydroxylase family protein [Candidatus Formimonas warabiya]|uniref:4-hydroxybutyryl-CoA dehydratase n=1 Tax=Formimonas warabiya TaxID=1761012 RepID=A0A3G1L263_FORW1|nr:4-hydroxyphenylacetate 3-hydroxylase family protein [Candidatus Formimonas warabiya]ATW28747.1 4-hydroxybutyryl-CoA dehydratase [Candidatus Formimonas warabiya]